MRWNFINAGGDTNLIIIFFRPWTKDESDVKSGSLSLSLITQTVKAQKKKLMILTQYSDRHCIRFIASPCVCGCNYLTLITSTCSLCFPAHPCFSGRALLRTSLVPLICWIWFVCNFSTSQCYINDIDDWIIGQCRSRWFIVIWIIWQNTLIFRETRNRQKLQNLSILSKLRPKFSQNPLKFGLKLAVLGILWSKKYFVGTSSSNSKVIRRCFGTNFEVKNLQ